MRRRDVLFTGLNHLKLLDLTWCSKLRDLTAVGEQRYLNAIELTGCTRLRQIDIVPLAKCMALERVGS
jgi:hypothetical protein